ncbi:MAG: hypothetical protein HY225_04220 [Candidatus Vogelbacteria bacterium]|nr:hypothetical protein [Candidatus Vogelbacteria bacterium]
MFVNYFNNFKTFFEKPLSTSGLSLGVDTKRDWKLLINFFVVSLLVLAALDYYLFYNVNIIIGNGDLSQQPGAQNFDPKKLEKVLADWGSKSVEFNVHETNFPAIVDPSL